MVNFECYVFVYKYSSKRDGDLASYQKKQWFFLILLAWHNKNFIEFTYSISFKIFNCDQKKLKDHNKLQKYVKIACKNNNY